MEEQQTTSSNGEIVKFLILVLVMAITVAVVWWSRPLIFQQIVPAVLSGGDAAVKAEDGDPDGATGEGESGSASEVESVEEDSTEEETAVESTETDSQSGDTSETESEEASKDDEDSESENNDATDDGETTHVVQPGETLFAIARRYDVTVSDIVEANELRNPNRVQVGQRLVIPTP